MAFKGNNDSRLEYGGKACCTRKFVTCVFKVKGMCERQSCSACPSGNTALVVPIGRALHEKGKYNNLDMQKHARFATWECMTQSLKHMSKLLGRKVS